MLKKTFAGSAAALLASISLMGAGLSYEGVVMARTLSFTSGGPPTDTGTNQAFNWWADEVAKRTDGSLKIEFHYMGSLVKLKDAVDGVSAGIADMGYVIPAYSQSKLPLFYLSTTGVGPGNAYVAMQAWQKVYEQSPALQQEEKKNNFKYLGAFSIGSAAILGKTRPYITPADFKGDKVRLASRMATAARLENWSVTPVNLTFPDIYSALERGTIDGATTYINEVVSYRHNEVAKHVVEIGIGQQTNIIFMNRRVWDGLSDKERAVFDELQPELLERLTKGHVVDAQKNRATMESDPKYPVQLHQANDEQMKAWNDAMQSAEADNVEKMAKRNPAAPEVHALYLQELEKANAEFKKSGYPWAKN